MYKFLKHYFFQAISLIMFSGLSFLLLSDVKNGKLEGSTAFTGLVVIVFFWVIGFVSGTESEQGKDPKA